MTCLSFVETRHSAVCQRIRVYGCFKLSLPQQKLVPAFLNCDSSYQNNNINYDYESAQFHACHVFHLQEVTKNATAATITITHCQMCQTLTVTTIYRQMCHTLTVTTIYCQMCHTLLVTISPCQM